MLLVLLVYVLMMNSDTYH